MKLLFLFLLIPQLCLAAISQDAVSNGSSDTQTATVSHIVGAGANKILIVCVGIEVNADYSPLCTSVTYNGDALTKVNEIAFDDSVASSFTYRDSVSTWYLLNPDEGTYDIVVTATSDTIKGVGVGAISLIGVNQAAPEAENSARGNSATAATTVTTTTDAAWVIDSVGTTNSTNDMTSSQTEIFENANDMRHNGSKVTKSPEGEQAMGWSLTSAYWGIAAVAVAPAAASSTYYISREVANGIGRGVFR